MVPRKRARDEESYDGQPAVGVLQTRKMTTVPPPHHPPPAPPPSGTNGHVANLLGQAKMSGLLLSNTTGGGYPSSSIPLAALGRIPKYEPARDPRVQQKNGGQNGNDTKRRKLSNKKSSPKKAAQPPKPQLAKNGKATKQHLKPSAKDSIDPKIIDNLIAEALAMQNGPNVPA